MRVGLLVVLLIMIARVCTAQSSLIDSIRNVIAISEKKPEFKPDTTFVKTLNNLAYLLSFDKPDSAVIVAERAATLSSDLNYPKGQLSALTQAVNAFEQQGAYLNAIEKLEEGIELAKIANNKKVLASFYSGAGKFYTYVGKYPEAINSALQSQRIAEEIKSEIIQADNYNTLAMVYFYQDKIEESLVHFEKCKEIVEALGDTITLVNVMANIGEIYRKQSNYAKAREVFNQSMIISREAGLTYYTGITLSGIGKICIREQQYDSALVYLQKAAQIQVDDKAELASILADIGFCYFNLKQYDKSISYCNQALEYSKQISSITNQRYVNGTLSSIYKALSQFEKALFHHEQFKIFSDSITSKESRDQTVRLNEEYKYEKKELALKAANEEKLAKRNAFIYVIAIGLAFAFVLIFMLVRNIRLRKRVNFQLMQNRDEIARQNKELEAMDTFKNRLLSVVAHDVRGPINSLKGMFYLFDRKSLSPEESFGMIKNLEGKVSQVSNFVDDLLLWARTQMTKAEAKASNFELASIIHETLTLLKPIAENKKIKIQAVLQEPFTVTADREMVKIVIRNLVSNAIKFSNADDVIQIQSSMDVDNQIKVSVRDSGVGMDESKLAELFTSPYLSSKGTGNEIGTGLGLLLCKQYIELNHGTIGAESLRGKGSHFWFTLPAN